MCILKCFCGCSSWVQSECRLFYGIFIGFLSFVRAIVKSESETWIRKKPQAVKRDRERMDQFNKDKMISSVRRSDRLISKSAQIDNLTQLIHVLCHLRLLLRMMNSQTS